MLRYTREQLMALRDAGAAAMETTSSPDIPADCRRRTHRGCRGNKKLRRKRIAAKQQRLMFKPCLPSIVMGNVRSLVNKMDELTALAQSQKEYRECSLMCFSETWLHEDVPDDNVSIAGFSTVRADRERASCGKSGGGRVAVLVNHRWCHPSHITVKERICGPDVELCTVGLRPYYLPREFSHVFVAVYVPPSANAHSACDSIHAAVARIQNAHPTAFIAISGDFNHVSLAKTLPTFSQFVNCSTREGKTLDHLYANVRGAYLAAPLPPLGRSDHTLVLLRTSYTPLVKRLPPSPRSVRRWTDESLEVLQSCFEVTDWAALTEPHGEDLDGLTDCITSYINFCVDSVVPTKTVSCYPNNKPWITKDIKATLIGKRKACSSGNKEEARAAQKKLKVQLSQARQRHGRKLEWKLQQNNMREVWSGMRTITGHKPTRGGSVEGDVNTANEFNIFFNRFDTAGTVHLQPAAVSPLPLPPPSPVEDPAHTSDDTTPPPPDTSTLTVTEEQVRCQLQRLKAGKAPGPDGVSPRVLKGCAPQLSGVLHQIFSLSLSLQRVPLLWKTSCLVPVPKTPRPSDPKDYRPVALTSHIMKTLERLVLQQLRPMVQHLQDPLQFAYQPHLGVDDAILTLLHRVYSHLDKPAATVRIMFFDFSSAFNTIRPALLAEKLAVMQVDASLVSWIVDYLTGRPQYVRLQSCVSDRVVSNTGAPQGTVLSPFLFTLYTTDFNYCSQSCHLQKFSDDSAVVGCISGGDEEEYRTVVDNFVTWSEENHLQLNVMKTKELVVDLRRTKAAVTPISIRGVSVDVVEEYKYLGVYLDNKLDWSRNVDAVYKKGQSRLYFLRRLRSFDICRTMLRMFYESMVASAIMYAVVCWGSSLRVRDTNRLEKIIRKAGHVVGEELDSLAVVLDRRMLDKIWTILDSPSHPLHEVLANQRSSFSHRLRLPRCSTERHRKSFLPVAIKLLNAAL